MIIIHQRCAGLDVHKRIVVACCLWMLQDGTHRQETRTFGTTTAELLKLLDWLQEWGITCVAMESTAEYWKSIFNILEGNVEIHQSAGKQRSGQISPGDRPLRKYLVQAANAAAKAKPVI